jgi:thioesterase domain-containing protein
MSQLSDGGSPVKVKTDRVIAEQYLLEHIPLSKAMAITVTRLDEQGVTLSARLSPNLNHHCTAFGGSISAVAILSAWTLVHARLRDMSVDCDVVIQSNQIDYLRPIRDDFESHCIAPASETWNRLADVIRLRGKGRISLDAEVCAGEMLCAKFSGAYVGIKR